MKLLTGRPTATIVGYAALTLILTTGAAQSLSGSNTVLSDDIVDGQVTYADIRDNAMTGKKILDNSITGADVNESTLGMETAEATDEYCSGDSGVENCAVATLNMSRAGKVYIAATFEYFSDDASTAWVAGVVRLVVDGTTTEEVHVAHQGNGTADEDEYPMPIHDLVNLSAGSHEIKLTFAEAVASEDPDVGATHIVAMRLGAQS